MDTLLSMMLLYITIDFQWQKEELMFKVLNNQGTKSSEDVFVKRLEITNNLGGCSKFFQIPQSKAVSEKA